jgi:hypothetical protein
MVRAAEKTDHPIERRRPRAENTTARDSLFWGIRSCGESRLCYGDAHTTGSAIIALTVPDAEQQVMTTVHRRQLSIREALKSK